MKLSLRKLYFFISSAVIYILHIPSAFGKGKHLNEAAQYSPGKEIFVPGDTSLALVKAKGQNNSSSLYESMHLGLIGLPAETFEYAIKGFNYLQQNKILPHSSIISIADFSLPSSSKRLFVIDLEKHQLLFCTYVAHGSNSGTRYANKFSNEPGSNESSPGFYKTLDTYIGKNGYSLRLDGLEPGINDNAFRRDIVMHAAAYVNEGLARSRGYIGRSWGCPAVPEELHKPIIDKIKNGTCLFIFSPDNDYLNNSKILNASS